MLNIYRKHLEGKASKHLLALLVPVTHAAYCQAQYLTYILADKSLVQCGGAFSMMKDKIWDKEYCECDA